MFFSDAVFAIAITVLILDIRLPAGGDVANDGQLLSILTGPGINIWLTSLVFG